MDLQVELPISEQLEIEAAEREELRLAIDELMRGDLPSYQIQLPRGVVR